MEANGVFEPPDEDMETWFVILGYSSGVLVFHVMDYYWQKLGLGDLLEPPKKRWAYGGCNIWFGMLMPVMWSQPFFSEFGFDEMAPIGKWGWGITIFLYGLAFVWWASTEAEKAEPPTSD